MLDVMFKFDRDLPVRLGVSGIKEQMLAAANIAGRGHLEPAGPAG